MYTMTYHQLTEEFGCSSLIATLGLTTYIFGLGEDRLIYLRRRCGYLGTDTILRNRSTVSGAPLRG
jgi:hypothetical protein